MINNRELKTFISFFTLIICFLSLVLPKINEEEYYAATVKSTTESSTKETTKKKSHGHKMAGAEYYDELWEKYHVIAADNGGGSGEGGGAGDRDAKDAGNAGEYDEAGGLFGQAAGVGQGSGSKQNQSGTGAGTTGGSTGSVTADAYRKLKANIEESKAESLAKVLETANNAKAVVASIAARESEQASIQRRLKQESIKASIEAAEIQRQMFYETPVYIDKTLQSYNYVLDAATRAPTSKRRTDSFGAYDNKIPPSRNYATAKETIKASDTRTNIIISEETLSPINNNVTLYDGNNIVPSEINTEENIFDNYISIPMPDTVATFFDNNEVNAPTTIREIESQYEEVSSAASLETFDTPLIYEETSIIIEEEIATELQTTEAMVEKETESTNDDKEGKGSKGGKDAEADEDMKGKEGENESQGKADEKGQYQLETKGEFAGKKIFELKQNGNFGFVPEHLSVAGLKNFMTSGLTLLLLIGALLFIISTKDKKSKDSYF